MTKPTKPSLPSFPKKPDLPEIHVWIDRIFHIKDFDFIYDVEEGYYGNGVSLGSAVLSETDLNNINNAVREFKEKFDISNVKDLEIDLKNAHIWFKEKVENPNLEQQQKKWLVKFKEYEQNIEKYEKLKNEYDILLANYTKDMLVFELESTRKQLARLEQKVKQNV